MVDVSVVKGLQDALAVSDHLLSARYAATIAAAQQLAVRMDNLAVHGWTDEAGKLDNVTVPTFLRYMEALGLTVPKATGVRPAKGDTSSPEAPEPAAEAVGQTVVSISSLQDRAAKRKGR